MGSVFSNAEVFRILKDIQNPNDEVEVGRAFRRALDARLSKEDCFSKAPPKFWEKDDGTKMATFVTQSESTIDFAVPGIEAYVNDAFTRNPILRLSARDVAKLLRAKDVLLGNEKPDLGLSEQGVHIDG